MQNNSDVYMHLNACDESGLPETQDTCMDATNVSSYLWIFFPPILLVFGITGNVLAFMVLRKRMFCCHPTSTFLTFLAVNDTVVLLTGLTRYWINYAADYDIRRASDVSCKLYYFVIYVSMQYSSWILVGVATERLVKTYFPFRYKQIYTCRKATVGLLVTLFVLVLVNVHFFFTNGINAKGCCDSLAKYEYFNNKIFTYIDFILLCAAPFIIMFICNTLLVRILRAEQKRRTNMVHQSMLAAANRFSIRMTKMLLLCTIYFVLATAPVSIYFIVDSYLKPGNKAGIEAMDIVHTVTYLIQYTNYCINFYLYTAMNDRFLKEAKNLLCFRISFWLCVSCSTHKGNNGKSISSKQVNSTSAEMEDQSVAEEDKLGQSAC